MALAHQEIQGIPVRRFNIVRNLHLVRLPQGVSAKEGIEIYRRSPEVLYAEPNYTVKAYELPDDPLFPGKMYGTLFTT